MTRILFFFLRMMPPPASLLFIDGPLRGAPGSRTPFLFRVFFWSGPMKCFSGVFPAKGRLEGNPSITRTHPLSQTGGTPGVFYDVTCELRLPFWTFFGLFGDCPQGVPKAGAPHAGQRDQFPQAAPPWIDLPSQGVDSALERNSPPTFRPLLRAVGLHLLRADPTSRWAPNHFLPCILPESKKVYTKKISTRNVFFWWTWVGTPRTSGDPARQLTALV